MRPLRGVSLAAALLLLGGVHSGRVVADGAEPPKEGFSLGQRPPAFSALDLKGQRQTLTQYRGNIVVLHFWASWCPYCRGEIPKLLQIHEQNASQGVTILTISIDRDVEQLQAFVQQAGLPYSVIPDARSESSLANAYGVRGIPVTYILDRDGRVAFQSFGSGDLVGATRYLLEKSPAPSA